MNLPVAITAVLETAFNRYIELDPDGRKKLAALQGKVIAIDLAGVDMNLYFMPSEDGIHIMSCFDGEADTRLRGTPLSLLHLLTGQQTEDRLFSGDVIISGDTETGQQFKQILEQLDIDWEEQLSHISGDVIAYQVGRGVRNSINWGRQAEDTLLQDTSEYLQEEARLVATRNEVDDFNHTVDTVRNDVERLEARLKRLAKNIDSKTN